MFRIPLPYPDTALLLSPRWGDLSLAAQFGALLLCLAPPVLVVWLYRYEMHLVDRKSTRLNSSHLL